MPQMVGPEIHFETAARFVQVCFAVVLGWQLQQSVRFTPLTPSPYTSCEAILKAIRSLLSAILLAVAICFFGVSAARSRAAQAASQKPSEKIPEKTQEKPRGEPAAKASPEVPAQIELLETRVRFETDGSSRKEVHARVKINDELGVRQFARLSFDFNRSFQQVEIPLVRITHPSGGVIDVLPSAITDQPNPAVINAPAYQDVRVKSVRILGLEPGDSLEYRVITTTSHAPLAPDFWLEHTFDRSGVVADEIFELDLPSSNVQNINATQYSRPFTINPATPVSSTSQSGEGVSARTTYRWDFRNLSEKIQDTKNKEDTEPDVSFSTFGDWQYMSIKLAARLLPGAVPIEKLSTYADSEKEMRRELEVAPEIKAKAAELTGRSKSNKDKLEAIYDFVSRRISTVDLPLGAMGFIPRRAESVLADGYGTQEEKYVLFAALAAAESLHARAALTGYCNEKGTPRPSAFQHLIVSAYDGRTSFWLDPSVEVAPFGMIPPSSGKCAFILDRHFLYLSSLGHGWEQLHIQPLFRAFQRVNLAATVSIDGKLTTKAEYTLRGDNELLLRVAFHKTPKENWKNVAQLLALSDGFRGQITDVSASDPYETHTPFAVEYEIVQPMFVNWSKKPVRIPALLPLLGLPDPAGRTAAGTAAKPIELGTPLDVEVSATVQLPHGTTGLAPTGTSIERDFATYTSQYSVKDATISASRHLNFILKEIPADRAADYDAFLQAVQNDESQFFTLERTETNAAKPSKP